MSLKILKLLFFIRWGHWRVTEGFHDILWNPRFVVAASQLLGTKAVRFWHDQLFLKPAHHGGGVAYQEFEGKHEWEY